MNSITPELRERLTKQLAQSWLKRETAKKNTASVAIATHEHYSGLLESRTHLLDITSEHAALAQAVSCKDPHVNKLITLVQGSYLPNPVVLKILADHSRRTGTIMSYSVFDMQRKEIFHMANVLETYYQPPIERLEKIKDWTYALNQIPLDSSQPVDEQLRIAAVKGTETHFSADSKTVYGCAVLTDGTIFYGGVYSSYDHRLNLHAEMVAALSAIASDKKNITQLCIVSNKFVHEVPHVCGCCRQFLAEISAKNNTPITILSYSWDGTQKFTIPLTTYLPYAFDSGGSIEEFENPSKL